MKISTEAAAIVMLCMLAGKSRHASDRVALQQCCRNTSCSGRDRYAPKAGAEAVAAARGGAGVVDIGLVCLLRGGSHGNGFLGVDGDVVHVDRLVAGLGDAEGTHRR